MPLAKTSSTRPSATPRLTPRRTRWAIILAILPALLLLAGAPRARAQIDSREGIALRDQILELRHEVDMLRASIGDNGGSALGRASASPPPTASGTSDMVVRLLDRMNTLEDEIRTLRGHVDELQNDLQQQTADLGKQISDLKFEVENPGAPGTAAPAHLPARPGAPLPHPVPHESGNPIVAARAALARRDYAGAEQAAHTVLARRAAPDAYEAQFIMAEALAGQHQWSRAAIAYDDAYNRSKKGPRAPAALLGLAESLAAINEHRAACETLAQLRHQFPREGAALRAQAAAVARRAACR